MPKQKPITLNALALAQYAHLGATTEFDDLPPEDAFICRQIGLFFAANLHLAMRCDKIEEITLKPRSDDKPPLAELTIKIGKRTYRLTSNEAGQVPEILGRRILHNPKRRRRRPRR